LEINECDGGAVRIQKTQERITTMKNRMLTFAGVLALLAVLGHYYAKPLLAQVRAVLAQDVDNPARHPYTQEAGSPNCERAGCSIFFISVPPGKRLVVQQVNTFVRPTSISTIVDWGSLISDREPCCGTAPSFRIPMNLIAPAGVFPDNVYSGNLAVVAYYEPGSTPVVITHNRAPGGRTDLAIATISGYLVDLP
jgi:hypothetical protein